MSLQSLTKTLLNDHKKRRNIRKIFKEKCPQHEKNTLFDFMFRVFSSLFESFIILQADFSFNIVAITSIKSNPDLVKSYQVYYHLEICVTDQHVQSLLSQENPRVPTSKMIDLKVKIYSTETWTRDIKIQSVPTHGIILDIQLYKVNFRDIVRTYLDRSHCSFLQQLTH